MGVLRSVSGLQMYQRAVRGPIEGPSVVRFLLEHDRFPRAVRALLARDPPGLSELPDPDGLIDVVDNVDAVLRESRPTAIDGAALDEAMDELQHRDRPARPGDPDATFGRARDPCRPARHLDRLDVAMTLTHRAVSAFAPRPTLALTAAGRGRSADRARRAPATSSTS